MAAARCFVPQPPAANIGKSEEAAAVYAACIDRAAPPLKRCATKTPEKPVLGRR
jgi:hypothetical protein